MKLYPWLCCLWGILLSFNLSFGQAPTAKHKASMASVWKKTEAKTPISKEEFQRNKLQHLQVEYPITATLKKEETDILGYTHQRYNLAYQGIPLEHAELVAHFNSNGLYLVNGKKFNKLPTATKASIPSEKALALALLEDTEQQAFLQRAKKENKTAWPPKSELVYTEEQGSEIPTLAYKYIISTKTPHDIKAIYVDAQKGKFIKAISLIISCNAQGTGTTLYNGSQSNVYTNQSGSAYHLEDNCRGGGIQVKFDGAVSTTSDNSWTNPTTESPAFSTHWASQVTYDYFLNVHGRNSFDDAGALMVANVSSDLVDNAYWHPVDLETTFFAGNTRAHNYFLRCRWS